MDILKNLPSLTDPEVERELDGREKQDRMQFHRDRIRNGPVKFKEQTTGQARRERQRALDRQTKKARRLQIKAYFEAQRKGELSS